MTFPALIPSTRIFSPGEYPHTAFGTWSLSENRVLHSNVMVESQLRLSFVGLTESQMLSILTHYRSVQGEYGVFSLPNNVFSGTSSPGAYTLARHFWRYAESPLVEDLPCGSHIVEIVLISTTPTIGRANGFIESVGFSLAAGEYVEAEPRDFPVLFSLSAGSVSITTDPIVKAVTYTGNGSTLSITGLGFKPGIVWTKRRTGATGDHALYEKLSGVTKYMRPSNTGSQVTNANSLTSFDSDGFSLGSAAISNVSSADYVAWCWPEGGTATSNTDGTITTSTSVQSTDKISVFTYSANGSANQTIGHGLGVQPDIVIIFRLNTTGQTTVGSHLIGNTQYLALNSTSARVNNSWYFNGYSSTTITLGTTTNTPLNASTVNYMGIALASVTGRSSISTYTGTGGTDNVITCGFTPQLIIIKAYSTSGDWMYFDSTRGATKQLIHTNAEETTVDKISIDPTGFTAKANENTNTNAVSYLYMAFA